MEDTEEESEKMEISENLEVGFKSGSGNLTKVKTLFHLAKLGFCFDGAAGGKLATAFLTFQTIKEVNIKLLAVKI